MIHRGLHFQLSYSLPDFLSGLMRCAVDWFGFHRLKFTQLFNRICHLHEMMESRIDYEFSRLGSYLRFILTREYFHPNLYQKH